VMSDITGFHIHRGVLAAVHRPTAAQQKQSVSSLIAKLQVFSHPGMHRAINVGSLIACHTFSQAASTTK